MRKLHFAHFVLLFLPLFAAATTAAAALALQETLPLSPWSVLLLCLGVGLLVGVPTFSRYLRPRRAALAALQDGLESLGARDFSLRLATGRPDELGRLAAAYNRMADVLQTERSNLAERELLLEAALESSPLAIVLTDARERVIFSNPEARRLLLGGAKLEGLAFDDLLATAPRELREILAGSGDGLFAVDENGRPETFHLSRRAFQINRRRHTLYLLRRLTRELDREEARIWKQVIRIISHELNNSLAPISSLAHSAGVVLGRRGGDPAQLATILATIEERVVHLKTFLEGYARFARLPEPRKVETSWEPVLSNVAELYPFERLGTPPESGYFDPAQIEQVLINLVKNAWEASEPGTGEVAVGVAKDGTGATVLQVLDRGRGLAPEAFRQALLPFYSTKPDGVGVGLPLCREILAGHGGTLSLAARPGGGTVVTCRLPDGP